VEVPKVAEGEVVTMLRTRPVPDPTQARFTIKMHSKPLKIIAPRLGGGLVVDRPDRAFLVILDPLGSPVLELATDGRRVVFVNHHDRQYVTQDNAAASLGDITNGALTLPDVVGMLIGLLPIDQARVMTEERTPEGLELVRFEGPQGLLVTTWVDPTTATPRRVEVDNAKHERVVNATYQPFAVVDGSLLPSQVDLEVPSVELTVNVDFRVWKPIASAPDVFSPPPPDRYAIIPFADFVEKMGRSVDEPPPTDGK
jgi:hypothetical protein